MNEVIERILKVEKNNPIPRYHQVEKKIEYLIENNYLRPGDKLIPERELASILGVDRNTVRRAISRLIEKKTLYREWGRGTFVSKRLKVEPKVKNLGLTLWEKDAGIGHYSTMEVLRGLKEGINKEKRYGLMFLFITEEIVKKHTLHQLLEKTKISGLLIRISQFKKKDIKKVKNIPVVLLEPYGITDYPEVSFDYQKGFYIACEYLIKTGHKKIALINGPRECSVITEKVLLGYQRALKDYGISYQRVKWGKYNEGAGYILTKELLKNSSPTAIITGDDTIAVGAIKAIKEKGLDIPEDISIIGCNDMPIASYIEPPLTTIKVPFYEIGKSAAELLVKIIEGEKIDNYHINFEPELIIRESTRGVL